MTALAPTFTEELTAAHARGDEAELNRLLDMQRAVKDECAWRIDQANKSAADLAHQLHALANLIDGARAVEMDITNGDASLLKLRVAENALQEWSGR